MLLEEWNEDMVSQINQVLSNVSVFNYLVTHSKKVPRLEK